VKTDRRDAKKLAHFLRSGDLTEVSIPEEQTEAMRDLERAREDAVECLQRARHQLDKFLLRHDRRYASGKKKWTGLHRKWLREQIFAEESQRRTLDSYVRRLEQAELEVERLTKDIEELVENWALGPLVKALQAMRGIRLVSAVILVAEIGDFRRFARAEQFMAFLGLIPSEESSGQSRRQGRITRTGNRHVRKTLVESAWSYRHKPTISRDIKARQVGISDEVCALAWKAQQRLCKRYQQMAYRGKPLPKVVTAIARELAGFVWAVARSEKLLAS
jgi:transposase